MTPTPSAPLPSEPFRIERLDPKKHDRTKFTSTSPELDNWFEKQAGQQTRSFVAVTYVLVENGTNQIAGFYTLSTSSLDTAVMDPAMIRKMKLPKYRNIPAILLGRLAVDNRFQKKGLGKVMMASAITKTKLLTNHVGIAALIVDAKDENARMFYEHLGFESLEKNINRLILPVIKFAGLDY